MRERTRIAMGSAPFLPRGVRLRFDPVRRRHVLLAPERVLLPDETSVAILELCDGVTSVSAIVAALVQRYDARSSQLEADVVDLLQGLADRGYVRA